MNITSLNNNIFVSYSFFSEFNTDIKKTVFIIDVLNMYIFLSLRVEDGNLSDMF